MKKGGRGKNDRGTMDNGIGNSEDVSRDVEEAISDIRYIREVLNASRDFFVSGWPGIVWGICVIIGVLLTYWFSSHPPDIDIGLSTTLWILWIILGGFASVVETFFFFKRTIESGKRALSALTIKVILSESLMVIEGLILTFVFIHLERPEYIPGAWLLSLGILMTMAGFFIPGGIWLFGLITFLSSIVAIIEPSFGLSCVAFAGFVTMVWGVGYLIIRKR